MTTQFIPKQALRFDGALLQELQGDVSDTIARNILESDVPAITETSVIHDNGCGYGAVTMATMATEPPKSIQIYATDINPMFIAQLRAILDQNPSWPVTLEQMDASNLTFPDNTFTHSLTTFVFAGLQDDVSAAFHILRTLQIGGTALIAVWNSMPWHIALENAHHLTRGDEPMAPFLSKSWYKKKKLTQVLENAGWKDVKFIERDAWLNLGSDLKRWVTIAWSFLGTPVGGWQQRDEDMWDQAINSIVEELQKSEWHKRQDGVHKMRMVADIAIVTKE